MALWSKAVMFDGIMVEGSKVDGIMVDGSNALWLRAVRFDGIMVDGLMATYRATIGNRSGEYGHKRCQKCYF